MKNVTPFITKVASLTGIALGAFALVAIAGTWTPPTTSPPNGNVDAPINVGAPTPAQEKLGGLWIKGPFTLTDPLFKYKPSASDVVVGSVLTAKDALGTVEWGAAGGGAVKWIYVYGMNANGHFTPNTTVTIPAGISKVVITPTARMICQLGADNGRSMLMEFQASQGAGPAVVYAGIESGAGNNSISEIRIQGSTSGVVSVVPGTLTLSARSYLTSGTGNLISNNAWSAQGTVTQNCSPSNPSFYSSFKGYVLYGY